MHVNQLTEIVKRRGKNIVPAETLQVPESKVQKEGEFVLHFDVDDPLSRGTMHKVYCFRHVMVM